jgi:MFS family permease
MYLWLRIIAGIGLAGELGVGISFISESLSKDKRTYATTIVSAFGMFGAACGGLMALYFSWKLCYIIGGVAGLLLLILRVQVYESVIFQKAKQTNKNRGNIITILKNPRLLSTYFFCTLAGSVTFVIIGLFIQNTPEFAKEHGLIGVKASLAIIFFYLGAAPSEIIAGLMSKKLKSRKIPMYFFFCVTIVGMLLFCFWKPFTVQQFYLRCTILGLGLGYWTLLVTTAAEQFTTGIRATAATSIPNIARAWSIPFNILFKTYLKPSLGLIYGGLFVGFLTVILSIISVVMLKETFENNADSSE